jgi:hypothetical protein
MVNASARSAFHHPPAGDRAKSLTGAILPVMLVGLCPLAAPISPWASGLVGMGVGPDNAGELTLLGGSIGIALLSP